MDHKKYDKKNANVYMELPSTVGELQGTKPSLGGLSLFPKDQFTICVNLCSTKLTQSGNYDENYVYRFTGWSISGFV